MEACVIPLPAGIGFVRLNIVHRVDGVRLGVQLWRVGAQPDRAYSPVHFGYDIVGRLVDKTLEPVRPVPTFIEARLPTMC